MNRNISNIHTVIENRGISSQLIRKTYHTKCELLSIQALVSQLVLFLILLDCLHSNSICSKMLFLTVDPHSGHVNYASFSDQTLMEMLYEGFGAKAKTRCQDSKGMFLDVCEWHSVECDDDDNVVRFHDSDSLSGSLKLCYIPPKLETFRLQLKDFTGSIDLAQLPQSLWELNLESDKLEGSVDLTRLPENMKNLHLSDNRFSGSVELTQLPRSMKSLELQDNQFTGSFIAKNLPRDIIIDALNNKFSATAVVESQASAEIFLGGSGVASVIDEDGNGNNKAVCFFRGKFDFGWDCRK